LSFRLFIQSLPSDAAGYGGAVAGGALNAVTIIILNILWKRVATVLTEWENHRLESEYRNNLTFKIFFFYFFNSYTSLYYMAFFKGRGMIWNKLADGCKTEQNPAPTVSYGCTDEVTVQLVTLLAVNMFIGQATEVLIPWVTEKIKLYRLMKATGGEIKDVDIWERDFEKSPFDGTFDEYCEMVVQFGYMTLFASTFPIAPLMALLNNIVEIRTDGFKILSAKTRPRYLGAQNIGTWYFILEGLGIIAVVTNCALIGLSFGIIYGTVGGPTDPTADFKSLGVVVIMEHVIIAIKYLISFLVPDLPGWIIKKQAYEEFVKEESEKSERLKTFVKPTWSHKQVGDEFDDDKEPGSPGTLELRVE